MVSLFSTRNGKKIYSKNGENSKKVNGQTDEFFSLFAKMAKFQKGAKIAKILAMAKMAILAKI